MRKKHEEEVLVATVCLDYCFLRNQVGDDFVPVIVMKDLETRLLAAHVVLEKGANTDWVSQQLIRDLERWGIMVS